MGASRRTSWLLIALAALSVLGHSLVNQRYGFHRDELQVIEDARHLAWGYVIYPPVTPFVARVAQTLFGDSLVGLRLFSALGFGLTIVLGGLMARELGAKMWGQLLAAAAVAIAPVPLHNASLFQYVTWDYLAWVLVAYFALRLCRTNDPRWWLAIGAAIGLGMMTKYTIGVLVIGVVVGVLATARRRDLTSKCLWLGAALSAAIFLPNLIWQMQNHFVSVEALGSIHARDVAEGRAEGFIPLQFLVGANVFTAPLWLIGLWFYLFSARGKEFRLLGWLYLVPFALLILMKGRFYYLAPAYPMLLAAGSAWWEEKVARFGLTNKKFLAGATVALLLAGGILMSRILLPVAEINSPLWKKSLALTDDYAEEIGWRDLAEEVARIYRVQPATEKVAILCGNYGEAGAVDLYRGELQLPAAISGVNSFWARGYGGVAPDAVVLVGFSRRAADRHFAEVTLAGHATNRFGVPNEESRDHPDIFVCRRPRKPWPQLWPELRGFG